MAKGKLLRIITVGKVKTKCWKEACDYYLKMIKHWQAIETIEVKDSEANMSIQDRIGQEGERIISQIYAGEYIISLGEKGKNFTSPEFSSFLLKLDEDARKPVFIIGGPFGLSSQVLEKSNLILSLSKMTFPHEIARTLLLEQIYRANCIRYKFPYHH